MFLDRPWNIYISSHTTIGLNCSCSQHLSQVFPTSIFREKGANYLQNPESASPLWVGHTTLYALLLSLLISMTSSFVFNSLLILTSHFIKDSLYASSKRQCFLNQKRAYGRTFSSFYRWSRSWNLIIYSPNHQNTLRYGTVLSSISCFDFSACYPAVRGSLRPLVWE